MPKYSPAVAYRRAGANTIFAERYNSKNARGGSPPDAKGKHNGKNSVIY